MKVIQLHLQIDTLLILACIRVFDNLAVDLLLAKTFIDMYIQGTFPVDCKLMSWHSQSSNIILLARRTKNTTPVADHVDSQPPTASLADDVYHRLVAANADTLALHVHTQVLVKSIVLGR